MVLKQIIQQSGLKLVEEKQFIIIIIQSFLKQIMALKPFIKRTIQVLSKNKNYHFHRRVI